MYNRTAVRMSHRCHHEISQLFRQSEWRIHTCISIWQRSVSDFSRNKSCVFFSAVTINTVACTCMQTTCASKTRMYSGNLRIAFHHVRFSDFLEWHPIKSTGATGTPSVTMNDDKEINGLSTFRLLSISVCLIRSVHRSVYFSHRGFLGGPLDRCTCPVNIRDP